MNTLTQQNALQEMMVSAETVTNATVTNATLQENELAALSGSETETQPDHIQLVLPPVEGELTVMELNAGDYDPGF